MAGAATAVLSLEGPKGPRKPKKRNLSKSENVGDLRRIFQTELDRVLGAWADQW